MAFNKEDLELFKEKLLKIKSKESIRLDEVVSQLERLSENGKDEKGENTTSYSVQVENLLNSKSRLLKHLNQVNNALIRIENNHYGYCVATGMLIDKNRLLAVPTTTLSIEGKKIREKN